MYGDGQSVLITGSAGFIGSRVVTRFLHGGWRVIGLDSYVQRVHGTQYLQRPNTHGQFTEHLADLDSFSTLCALLRTEPIDAVIHLASDTSTGASLAEMREHSNTNVIGTANLLSALAETGQRPQRFVLASSRAVYGEGAWHDSDGSVGYPLPRSAEQFAVKAWDPLMRNGRPAHAALAHSAANTMPRPVSVYATTKLAQEGLVSSWCLSNQTSPIILRFQNVYGPGQSTTNPYSGVLTHFATTAALGNQLQVYEDGQILRDFIFVDDVIAAIYSAAVRDDITDAILDIGSGIPSTILEVANNISAHFNVEPPVITGQYRPGDIRSAFADTTAALEQLGWRPATSLSVGLLALCRHVEAELAK